MELAKLEFLWWWQEMLLLLLPLLNSSSMKNFLRPFSKDKSSTSAEDDSVCPICQASPTTPFLALPCEHRYAKKHISCFFLSCYVTKLPKLECLRSSLISLAGRYCYYCLRTRCAAVPSFRCSKCNEPVIALQRHGGGGVTNQVPKQWLITEWERKLLNNIYI